MRELSQIRDAVVSALAAEGVAALDAYPTSGPGGMAARWQRWLWRPQRAGPWDSAIIWARSSIPGPAHRGSCMESSWRR